MRVWQVVLQCWEMIVLSMVGFHSIVSEVLFEEGFLKSSTMQLKLVLRILVVLFTWLLMLLDNCAY